MPCTVLHSSRVNPLPQGWRLAQWGGAIPVKAMALAKDLEAGTVGVGAGMPANTGTAGARHCVAFFAGEPAPTGIVRGPGLVPFLLRPWPWPRILKLARSVWERACPRTPAQPVPGTVSHSSRVNPLPQGSRMARGWCHSCKGHGFGQGS
ncbi:Sensory box protein/GGDEF family protein (modular protein) [Pseudomonas sp. JV551A1]|uniref:Sensory box protein/GGDEF family protein (Modular protein) n=1 Tax=Pseudomonas inefficax TaxID=2078786 RepID=A0AAQ1SUB1_9PSED|nr:Sensory box protein/GGDEF family protein (modular protein) [Pseudomonas sp. JV551A1]SPO61814.1 Sensory box protein/GGDEF family protein (modular protein) [Pseudomonas inefficax]